MKEYNISKSYLHNDTQSWVWQVLTVKVSVSAVNFQNVLSGGATLASVCEQRKSVGEGRVQPTNTLPSQPHVLKHSIDQYHM